MAHVVVTLYFMVWYHLQLLTVVILSWFIELMYDVLLHEGLSRLIPAYKQKKHMRMSGLIERSKS